MASSESDSATSATSFLEQLINHRNRDLSFFLPMIVGFSRNTDRDSEGESDSDRARVRIFFINPVTQGMAVMETNRSLEDLFREISEKEGRKPASKASIEAMPKIVVKEEDAEKECVICLDGYEIGSEVREMPCKHMYHGKCIEKWLGVHGSCPVCRYQMPLENENKAVGGGGGDSDEERGRRDGRGEFWVSVSIRGNSESAATEGEDDNDLLSSEFN